MSYPLANAAAQWKLLRDRLLERMPDLAEDEETLLDTLEGITDINEQLIELARSAIMDKADADATGTVITKLSYRKSALTQRSEKKRQTVRHFMEDMGIHKLPAPDMTISRAKTAPGVQIIDLAALPDEFVRIKREPDKTAIKAALKAGRHVNGACLTNAGETLKIKI